MGVAYLDISSALLRDVLLLPESAEVIGSCSADAGIVRVLVDHIGIPAEATKVQALFRVDHGIRQFDRFAVVEQRRPPCPHCNRG